MIVKGRELQRVDAQLDVHIALHLAAAQGIGEFLGRLGDDRVAIIVEPVDQRADRGIFLILDQRGVIIGPQQIGLGAELGEQFAIVDVDANGFRRGIEIGAINKERNLLPWIYGHASQNSPMK
ncbi:hypothetical protein D3C87_1524110 [compost metagenome]